VAVGAPNDEHVIAALAALGGDFRVLSAGLVLPGLVDIHSHGVGGHDDVTMYWSNPSYSLRAAAAAGTTSMLATITAPSSAGHCCGPLRGAGPAPADGPTLDPVVVSALRRAVGAVGPGAAVLEGVHVEGPVVADLGGLPPGEADMPEDRFEALCDTLAPHLRVMTISPSKEARPPAPGVPFARLRALLRRGVVPAWGHDRQCTEEDITEALAACAAAGRAGAPLAIPASAPASADPPSQCAMSSAGGAAVAEAGHLTSSHGGSVAAAAEPTPASEPEDSTPPSGLPIRDRRSTDTPAAQRHAAGVPRPHITHLFNVCKLHHRDVGLANAGLLRGVPGRPDLPVPTVELIGDLIHVHAWAVAAALSARAARDVCFVTDAIAEPTPGATLGYAGRRLTVEPVDEAPGDSAASATASLSAPCRVVLEGTSTIAGSCDTLLATLTRLLVLYRLPLNVAVSHVSETPARIAGIPHVGTLAPGKRMDALLFGKGPPIDAGGTLSAAAIVAACSVPGKTIRLEPGMGRLRESASVRDDQEAASAALTGVATGGLPAEELRVVVGGFSPAGVASGSE